MDLERDLAISEGRWRGRLLTLGILAVGAIIVGVLSYVFFFRGSAEKARPTEDLTVGRATINANLLISGVADAQLISALSFRTSGRVDTINVKVGDTVTRGQMLASLESDDLANGVASAQANLALAQARLAELLEGATDAQRAAADQSVISAQVNRDRAERDVSDLLDDPTQAELTAAGQSVASAQAALNQAQRDRTNLLEGPTDAQIASAQQVVASAQTQLNQAQRGLDTLRAGPTASQLASAQQAVASAQAALNQAQRGLDTLRAGPTASQLAAAQQQLAAAQANLASAQAALESLTAGPSAAQTASAQSAVAAAQQGLSSAQTALENAQSNVSSTESALRAARTAYCTAAPGEPLCASVSIPLSSSTVDGLLDDLSDPLTNPALLSPINALIQANTGYVVALNSVETAQGAVNAAGAQLVSAQAALAALLAGPDASDVAAAQAAVTAAQRNRDLAQLNLDTLNAGPDADDIANAEDAVDSAQAMFDAAVAQYDDLVDSPDADDIANAEDAVRSAQAVYAAAAAQYDDLVDPPDAEDIARADDNINSAQAALDAALARRDDLLDGPEDSVLSSARDSRRAAQANLNAAIANQTETARGPRETQIEQQTQSVRAAQLAVEGARIRVRDAQISSPFDGTVAAVNLKAGEFTGVGSATPAIVLLTPDALVLKMSVGETDYPNVKLDQRGIALFDALPGTPFAFTVLEIGLNPTVTQGVVTYKVSAALAVPPDGPEPAPGMSANGQIITESRPNVVAVPPRAIRRSGGDQVVDVRRNGDLEEQVVATGFADANNVEILSGLAEGDVIVVPALVGGSRSGPDKEPTLPSGIR